MTAPEDNLPPVQPPSAGFLMQLFVVPLVIVVVIVMVSLMFNWLAHSTTKPEDLVQDLNKLNAGSWQDALTIANLLTDRQNATLRKDPQLANRLGEVLDEQLKQADQGAERIKLRIYLALALSVFEVDEGLPALVRAAEQQTTLADVEVRKTAIESLARRADVGDEQRQALQQNPDVMRVLELAAGQFGDQDPERQAYAELRLRAAYTLGVLGGEAATDLLHRLAADGDPMVRYNAVTGLARHGNPEAADKLIAMLREIPEAAAATPPQYDEITQTSILSGALRAVAQLAKAAPSLDRNPLREQVRALQQSPQLSSTVQRGIALDADTALRALEPTADAGKP